MGIQYRKARADEWEACIEMADFVFSFAHAPTNFEEILPKVYQAGPDMAGIHRIAVGEDGRIRGMVAVLPRMVVAAGKKLRMGYVGTVSVHPKVRGEGHMKRLMGDWIDELEGKVDYLVLNGQRQRYGYFGFTPGSIQYQFEVIEANIRHVFGKKGGASDGPDSREIVFTPLFAPESRREKAAFAVRMNEARPCYIERRPEEIEAILRTYGGKALAVQIDGTLSGYLVLKGRETVAELALKNPSDAGYVLAAFMHDRQLSELTFWVPVYERELITALAAFSEECMIKACDNALIRICDFANFLEAFLSLKAQTLGIRDGSFSAVIEGQPVTVTAAGGAVSVARQAESDAVRLSRTQAQELFLSLTAWMGDHAGIPDQDWNRIPQGWFPLPLFQYMSDEF